MNIQEQVKSQINFKDTQLTYYDMNKLASLLDKDLSILPFSIRVLLENLIRNYDEKLILEADIKANYHWRNIAQSNYSIFGVEIKDILTNLNSMKTYASLITINVCCAGYLACMCIY